MRLFGHPVPSTPSTPAARLEITNAAAARREVGQLCAKPLSAPAQTVNARAKTAHIYRSKSQDQQAFDLRGDAGESRFHRSGHLDMRQQGHGGSTAAVVT
jgi:hypothetical protein